MPLIENHTVLDDRTVLEDKTKLSEDTMKQIFGKINGKRPKLKIQTNGIVIEGLVDTGVDII